MAPSAACRSPSLAATRPASSCRRHSRLGRSSCRSTAPRWRLTATAALMAALTSRVQCSRRYPVQRRSQQAGTCTGTGPGRWQTGSRLSQRRGCRCSSGRPSRARKRLAAAVAQHQLHVARLQSSASVRLAQRQHGGRRMERAGTRRKRLGAKQQQVLFAGRLTRPPPQQPTAANSLLPRSRKLLRPWALPRQLGLRLSPPQQPRGQHQQRQLWRHGRRWPGAWSASQW